MAKVAQPLMSNEARGKVAGICYNSWRGSNIVKVKKCPKKSHTNKQLLMMSLMKDLSIMYGSLSPSRLRAWDIYADLHLSSDWRGSAVNPTGENAFITCSMLASLPLGVLTPILDPPFNRFIYGAPVSLETDAQDLYITWAQIAYPTIYIEARVRTADSPGRSRAIAAMNNTIYGNTDDSQAVIIVQGLVPGKTTVFSRFINIAYGVATSWAKSEYIL